MPTLSLTPTGYKKFIKEFRNADRTQASGTDIVVTYTENGQNITLYFQTPNFKFYKFSKGGHTYTMTNYNHVGLSGDLRKSTLVTALSQMSGTSMTTNHSIVVCMTSEAARSAVVYKHMISAIANGKILSDYFGKAEILFKNYKRTGEQAGKLKQDTTTSYYTAHWSPMDWSNYQRVFSGDTSKKGTDFREFQKKISQCK
jgi:hypothetical protein